MAELLPAAYQSIRDFACSASTIPNEWDYLELYDDTGTAVFRLSITEDSRLQWLDVDGDAILQIEADLTGSDSDIPLPTTFEYSAVWDAASGGNQISAQEQFATATLNQDGDNVVVTHTLEIPDQA